MAYTAQGAPQGAIKVSHRALEDKPYKHESYPGCRYHPDGSMFLVKNEEQDKALVPPWRDTPYPQKPIEPPPPEPTFEELKAEHVRLIEAHRILTEQNETLKVENDNARGLIAEHMQQAEAAKAAKKPGKKTDAA